MKCFNCRKDNVSLYSPKEITKFKIAFCKQCLELIKYQDLRYLENTAENYAKEEVKKLIRRK